MFPTLVFFFQRTSALSLSYGLRPGRFYISFTDKKKEMKPPDDLSRKPTKKKSIKGLGGVTLVVHRYPPPQKNEIFHHPPFDPKL